MTEIWILTITLLLVVVLYCYTLWTTDRDLFFCEEMSNYYKASRDSLSDALKEANDREFADLERIDRLTKERDELLAKLARVQKALDGNLDVDVAPQKDLT